MKKQVAAGAIMPMVAHIFKTQAGTILGSGWNTHRNFMRFSVAVESHLDLHA